MALKPTLIPASHVQILQMGLGAAIRRLINIEFQFRMGQNNPRLLEERELLITAMDHLNIEIGFDCDRDGVPDNMEIFQAAATTSCCRLLPTSSRREISPEPSLSKPTRISSSRKKSEPEPQPLEPVKKKKGLLGGLFDRDSGG